MSTAPPQITTPRADAPPVAFPRTAEEALEAARVFAARLSAGAAERDRTRELPRAELRALADTGLLTLPVPASEGGPGASTRTIVDVFRIARAVSQDGAGPVDAQGCPAQGLDAAVALAQVVQHELRDAGRGGRRAAAGGQGRDAHAALPPASRDAPAHARAAPRIVSTRPRGSAGASAPRHATMRSGRMSTSGSP